MTELTTILLCTAFGSFLFELAHITQDIWAFFKIRQKGWWYIPVKLTTCGKCASFHTTWIYFYAINTPFATSISFACVSGIIAIFIIKYSHSTGIN